MQIFLPFLILHLLSIVTSIIEVQRATSQDFFFDQTFKQNHLLFCLYDSSNDKNSEQIIKRLTQDLSKNQILSDRKYSLGILDLAELPVFREHYKISENMQCLYFIKQQLLRFDKITDFFSNDKPFSQNYQNLLQSVTAFLDLNFSRIAIKINSLSEFKDKQTKHKIFGIYLGSDDQFLRNFKDFAAKHIDFDFYYSDSSELNSQIFSFLTSDQEMPDFDVFGIVRSQILINEFDTQKFVFVNPNVSSEITNIFFDFERYPKLRQDTEGDMIEKQVFHQNQVLVVYIQSKEEAPKNLIQFKEAVKTLPKRFIYTYTSPNSLKFGSFMQYFLIGGSNFEEEKVFIIHRSIPSIIKIEPIRGDLSKENIQNFVYNFYQKNKQLFAEFDMEKVKQEESREKQNEENLQSFTKGQEEETIGEL